MKTAKLFGYNSESSSVPIFVYDYIKGPCIIVYLFSHLQSTPFVITTIKNSQMHPHYFLHLIVASGHEITQREAIYSYMLENWVLDSQAFAV